MVLIAIFNNISAISWRSVLLVEETRVPSQTLSHNSVSSTPFLNGTLRLKALVDANSYISSSFEQSV